MAGVLDGGGGKGHGDAVCSPRLCRAASAMEAGRLDSVRLDVGVWVWAVRWQQLV